MKKFEAPVNQETVSEFAVEMMNDKDSGEEFTREYLKAKFLSSAGRSLYYARRWAGLTQAQIAERLHTTQSAIARLEADKDGAMTFHRYADFAIACGLMPRSLMLEPILESIETLRDEMIARAKSGQREETSHARHSDSAQVSTIENSPAHL